MKTENIKKFLKNKDANAKGVIKVTLTIDYIVPKYESMSLEQIAEEWFNNEKFPLGRFHAYRDGSQIGNSETVVKTEIFSADETV